MLLELSHYAISSSHQVLQLLYPSALLYSSPNYIVSASYFIHKKVKLQICSTNFHFKVIWHFFTFKVIWHWKYENGEMFPLTIKNVNNQRWIFMGLGNTSGTFSLSDFQFSPSPLFSSPSALL